MTVRGETLFKALVDADVRGAVREFKKLGTEAERTDSKIDKVGVNMQRFGAAAVGAAGVAAVGLWKLGQGASDLNEQMSKSSVVFGDAADDIEEFANKAAQAAGLSKTAALQAAGSFGVFGKAAGLTGDDLAGFSTDLVQLAADMASFSNTSVDEAVLAIGAALRGESEPIRQYGVMLDDATLKARALEMGIYDGNGALTQQQKILAAQAEIFGQTADAQGDFARTSDGLANQQRILKAELQNLADSIGTGVLPMMQSLVSNVTGVVSAFNGLPASTRSTIGTVAAVGVAALGTAGSISFVAGQVITMRDRFKNADGTLNKFGRTAVGAGKGLLAFGAAAAAIEVLNIASDASGDIERAMQNLVINLDTGGDAITAFGELARQEGQKLSLGNIISDFGREFDIGGVTANIEEFDRAFDKLLSTSPEQARALLEAMGELYAGMDPLEDGYGDLGDAIGRYSDRYMLAVGATEALTKANPELATALDGAETALDEAEDSADNLTTAFDRLKAAYDQLTRPIENENTWLSLQTQFDELAAKGTELGEQVADGQMTAEQAMREMEMAVNDQKLAVAEYAEEVLGIPPEQTSEILAMIDAGMLADAEELLAFLTRDRDVQIRLNAIVNASGGAGGNTRSANGRITTGPITTLVGEAGPEAILPLTRPGRMAALVNDPRVRGPVLRALGGGGSIGVRSSTTYHVHIDTLVADSADGFADDLLALEGMR